MTDRDRLIELIGNLPFSAEYEKYNSSEWAEQFADYLLANGVIVLPCKVGDVVYFANESYHDAAEIDGIQIDENGISFTWVQYEVGVDITELWDEGDFDLEDIGKTVFLTKEEAEKALERSGE